MKLGCYIDSSPMVQLLYAGFVSCPFWPLCTCQCEGLLTSLCACILINKPKAMPALISVAEAEDIDLSNPELIIIVMPAGSEECYYVVLYLLYCKIKQLI